MRSAKICIVGDFGVGKTSTVARFVKNQFSEKYLTTVGVKIDTKEILIPNSSDKLKLVIWDIAGADRFAELEYKYLRGAAGYILVVDGTRAHTLDSGQFISSEISRRYGDIPFCTLLNKHDLTSEWEFSDEKIAALGGEDNRVYLTSAKTGDNVEKAMRALTAAIAANFQK